LGVTFGQGNEKLVNVGSAPLSVVTFMSGIWLRLSPVINSMVICVQVPVVSGVHCVVQLVPSLKTLPGLGAVGMASARTNDARVANTVRAANIMVSFVVAGGVNVEERCGRGDRKKSAINMS